MVHRGPDDEGIYTQGNIGLGMRRLSIIDLANGYQPLSAMRMVRSRIVFNGEIYNQSDLRQQLTARSHALRVNGRPQWIRGSLVE
jgi:asparagine synthase (glutamine-hydrolysing)